MLLAHSAVACHRSASAHSTGLKQRITCRTAASPAGRRVTPCIGAAAHGLPVCISAYAGRSCSISRPWDSVMTAAAGPAANGSTGDAAGKGSRWNSKMDSRKGRSAGKPKSSSRNCARGRAADNGSDRSAAGAASTPRQPTGHQSQQTFKRPKKDRNPYHVNGDLNACTSVAELQKLVQQDGPVMDFVNLTTAIVRFQKILSKNTSQEQQQVTQAANDLFSQLWLLLQPKLPQCKARQLSNMIYSVCLLPTPLQQKHQRVLAQHLLPAFMRQLCSANAQDVSNVVYGLADSGQQLPRQSTQMLIDQLVAVLPDASIQSIANTIWAVATMKQQIQPMQQVQLVDTFCAVAHEAKPQNIANIIWAVATMQQQVQPTQMQQLLDAFCAVAQKAKPQEIANTLWAVATMKQQVKQGQLDQMLGVLVMQLDDAVPQEVSNTLWACAEFRYLPKHLLTAPALLDKLAAANPQELVNTAWACGQLGYRDEHLMRAVLNRVLDFVGTGKQHLISSGVVAQNFTNLCWSLAVSDLREHASAVLTLVQAAKPLWDSIAPEGLRQLNQVHMWLIDHGLAGDQGLAAVLTAQQLQQCQSTRQELLERYAASGLGPFHQSVFKALQRVADNWLVPPAMEQVSLGSDGQPDGAALIDITARTADGVWLAVEVDGPTHFRRPDGGLMGPTLYRNRALAIRGYVLISVPYYEWDIQHSSKLKQQYLQDKVTAALQQAAVNKLHPQLEEVAQPQVAPQRRHRQLISSSSKSRSVGSKLNQLDHGDRNNAAGNNFDPAKTTNRASIDADGLGNTSSQGGRVRRTRHKRELP